MVAGKRNQFPFFQGDVLALEIDIGANGGAQFLQPGGITGVERLERRVQRVDQPCAFGMLLLESLDEFVGFRASHPKRREKKPFLLGMMAAVGEHPDVVYGQIKRFQFRLGPIGRQTVHRRLQDIQNPVKINVVTVNNFDGVGHFPDPI